MYVSTMLFLSSRGVLHASTLYAHTGAIQDTMLHCLG